jgi:hypothetical protein
MRLAHRWCSAALPLALEGWILPGASCDQGVCELVISTGVCRQLQPSCGRSWSDSGPGLLSLQSRDSVEQV